jgi:hypothetical protein
MLRFRDIDLNPPLPRLRRFGWWGAGALAIATALLWATNVTASAAALAIALVLLTVSTIWPAALRPLYLVLTVAAFPVGWTVSTILVLVLYFIVLTPTAWIARLFRRSPHEHAFDPHALTYWVPRSGEREAASYLDQF